MSREIKFICINCKCEHVSPNKHSCRAKFCSKKCQSEFQKQIKIKQWIEQNIAPGKHSMRKYLIELRGHKCESCNLKLWLGKPITLEIEHKDGNSDNNSVINLLLLCPNCHSQTDTYKGKNRGKGRYSRRLRYSLNKSY